MLSTKSCTFLMRFFLYLLLALILTSCALYQEPATCQPIPKSNEFTIYPTPISASSYPSSINLLVFEESLRIGRGTINTVSYSPDGQVIAVGGSLGLWFFTNEFEEIGHINLDKFSVSSIAWSPDGKKIAISTGTWKALIFDVEEHSLISSLETSFGAINEIAWSPNGTKIAGAVNRDPRSKDDTTHTVQIWNVTNPNPIMMLKGHTSFVKSVDWNPNDNTIASGSSDKTIRIWDLSTGEPVITIHDLDVINSVRWNPDGNKLVSAGYSRYAQIFDTQTGESLVALGGNIHIAHAASWNSEGTMLAISSSDGITRIFEAESGRLIKELKGHYETVQSNSWDPLNQRIVTSGKDNTVRLWDISSGEEIQMLPGFTGETLSLAWNPSKDIIATGGRDGIIRTWDILTGNPLVTINHNEHESEIESIIWTPDGRSLISPGYGSIWWWEATTGNLIKVVYTDAGLEDYTDPTVYREMDIDQLVITSIDISPDSMVLASVGWDKIIRLWDMSNDQALSEWSAHSEWIDEVIWHPKQQRIATSSFDCTIRIWDTEKSGELIYTLYGHSSFVKDIDWSPDGKYISSVSDDGTVHIWDNETGYPVVIIDEQSSMRAAAWNPIYEILAIGRLDGIVTIWDTNKWIPVSELRIETSNNDDSRLPAVVSIEWSTNGDYLAIASRDGTVRIFTYQFK